MSDLPTSPDDQNIDTGQPIEQLQALREPPTGEFHTRVRSGIQRRIFASDAIDFSLKALLVTCFGYLIVLLESTSAKRKGGDRS